MANNNRKLGKVDFLDLKISDSESPASEDREFIKIQGFNRPARRSFNGRSHVKNSSGKKMRSKRIREGMHNRHARRLDRQFGHRERVEHRTEIQAYSINELEARIQGESHPAQKTVVVTDNQSQPDTKVCRVCGEEKALTEFHSKRNDCKVCRRAADKARRIANKVK